MPNLEFCHADLDTLRHDLVGADPATLARILALTSSWLASFEAPSSLAPERPKTPKPEANHLA